MQKIPVFFNPAGVVDADSFSKSPLKPLYVVEQWRERYPARLDERLSDPVSRDHVKQVHNPFFVDGILSGLASNGFGTKDRAVADSLLYTSGMELDAALCALDAGVACAPVSGFHHAHYQRAQGFCTFNGLVIAARALKLGGHVERVAILDLDYHWGDGTYDLIQRHRFSNWLKQWSMTPPGSRKPVDSHEFLVTRLPEILRGIIAFKPDLVLYQAGADQHKDDPFGGLFDDAQLAARDVAVFSTLRHHGIPVAWNLAGGYQNDDYQKVLDIHNRTFEAAVRVFCD